MTVSDTEIPTTFASMDSAAIAARITALLEEKGWTARELGRRAGFGDSSVASNTLKRLSEGKGASHRKTQSSRILATQRHKSMSIVLTQDCVTATFPSPQHNAGRTERRR
jgi:hypothetical protein